MRFANTRSAPYGVLLHQFDKTERCDQTWCKPTSDRYSAVMVNSLSPKGQGDEMPLYSKTASGYVVSPDNTVLCSWGADSGTMTRLCDPPGVSATCVPGCYEASGKPAWCDNPQEGGYCAFKPDETDLMLRYQNERCKNADSCYNEVIIEAARWEKLYPFSIEAVFFIETGGYNEEVKARQEHAKLRTLHGLSGSAIPLLKLDTTDFSNPFMEVDNSQTPFLSAEQLKANQMQMQAPPAWQQQMQPQQQQYNPQQQQYNPQQLQQPGYPQQNQFQQQQYAAPAPQYQTPASRDFQPQQQQPQYQDFQPAANQLQNYEDFNPTADQFQPWR